MDLTNGYYEDCNKKLYKVEADQIYFRAETEWKPLLYPQNFVMYWKHGLLTKKDICELELENCTLPLYLEGDCPEEAATLPLTVDEEIFLLEEELDSLDINYSKALCAYDSKSDELFGIQGILDRIEEQKGKVENKIKTLLEELNA